MLKYAV